jgi:hypothetical protein
MIDRIEKINELLQQLRSEISALVSDSVINTINVMFEEQIEAVPGDNISDNDNCIAVIVALNQDIFEASMLFTFDHDLIHRLISKVYPDELLKDNFAYEDTACEITNIVCNRVKALVNSCGLELEMELPYINKLDKPYHFDNKVTSVHFTLDQSSMHVDLGMNNAIIAEKM